MSVLHPFGRKELPTGANRVPTVESLAASSAGREVATHLVGDRHRPIAFDDVHRGPDPEWSRPANAAKRQRAQRHAEAVFRQAFDPHGIPPGFEVCPVDMLAVAATRASVEENLAAIAAALKTMPEAVDEQSLREPLAAIAALLAAETETAVSA